MPLQLLNLPNRTASLGSSFGEALGGSLAGGLDVLAQHKLNQIGHQKRVQGLAAIGLPPEYADLDPKILEQVVHQKLQEPSQMAFAQGLQAILSGGQPSPQAVQMSPQQSMGYQPTRQELEGEALGNKIFGNNPPPGYVPSAQRSLPPAIQQSAQFQHPLQRKQEAVQRQQGIPPEVAARLNPQQALQLAQLGLQKQALTKKEEIAQLKFDKQLNAKEQAQANKETLPYYNEILKEDKAAKKIDMDTQRMVKLIEKGNLPNPLFYKYIKDAEEYGGSKAGAAAGAVLGGKAGSSLGKVLGVPGGVVGYGLGAAAGGVLGSAIGSVLSPLASLVKYGVSYRYPDTEEFEKLSASFISGAKAIFGSRVTDQDLKAFMMTVPQLTNTDAGKKAIIRNIEIMNKASHVRADAMKKIIKANGGHRPSDLAIRVEEVSGPELDKLSQEFIG